MVHLLQKMVRLYPFIQQNMMHLPNACLFLFEMCNFLRVKSSIYIYILCICLCISYIHAVMLYHTVICLHIFGVSQVLMFIDFWDNWNYLHKLNSGRFP